MKGGAQAQEKEAQPNTSPKFSNIRPHEGGWKGALLKKFKGESCAQELTSSYLGFPKGAFFFPLTFILSSIFQVSLAHSPSLYPTCPTRSHQGSIKCKEDNQIFQFGDDSSFFQTSYALKSLKVLQVFSFSYFQFNLSKLYFSFSFHLRYFCNFSQQLCMTTSILGQQQTSPKCDNNQFAIPSWR